MKTSYRRVPAGWAPGLTLVELSVMLAAVLMLLGMAFIGVRGWKRGADRSSCVLNIRHMQVAVRGYSNSLGLAPGENIVVQVPPINLADELVGPGKYLPKSPVCPGRGVYSFGGNTIPHLGQLYMECSLAADDDHTPKRFDTW